MMRRPRLHLLEVVKVQLSIGLRGDIVWISVGDGRALRGDVRR
jgi:hypothetical protein